jgi:hypothetical protein
MILDRVTDLQPPPTRRDALEPADAAIRGRLLREHSPRVPATPSIPIGSRRDTGRRRLARG